MSNELILPIVVGSDDLKQILGREKYSRSRALLQHASLNTGVSLGLAWTPYGGEVLVIETLLSEGTGKLVLTGKLGDVIKESVQVSFSWLRSKASIYNLDFSGFKDVSLELDLYFMEDSSRIFTFICQLGLLRKMDLPLAVHSPWPCSL